MNLKVHIFVVGRVGQSIISFLPTRTLLPLNWKKMVSATVNVCWRIFRLFRWIVSGVWSPPSQKHWYSHRQVVRYSALIGGVLYGVMHRRTLQAKHDLKKEQHHAERREQLIQQAREAWRDKQQAAKGDGSKFIISNPFLLLSICVTNFGSRFSHHQSRRSSIWLGEAPRKMGKGILVDF